MFEWYLCVVRDKNMCSRPGYKLIGAVKKKT